MHRIQTHSLKADVNGRVPFALVALVILSLATVSSLYIAEIDKARSVHVLEHYQADTNALARACEEELETVAYYILMRVIADMNNQHNPPLDQINKRLQENFTTYVNTYYKPKRMDTYWINVTEHHVYFIMDIFNVNDSIEISNQSRPEFLLYASPSTNEIDMTVNTMLSQTKKTAYPRVAGNVTLEIKDVRANYTLTKTMEFDKNLYSALPMMRNAYDYLARTSFGDFGELGRLTKFILTTIAQYRVLLGYAGGGYGIYTYPKEQVLTQDDVKIAVNLAMLLLCTRYFRDYDREAAAQLGVSSLFDSWVKNGTVDAADIWALYANIKDTKIDTGKILAQSIYSFADRFAFELLAIFWDPDTDYFADPILKEPFRDWNEARGKGEAWAKAMLKIWLGKFREWLGLAESISDYQDSAYINEMYGWYYAYCPVHRLLVAGKYTVFPGGTWYVHAYGVPDTRDLILGESGAPNLDAQPYKIETWDDFSGIGTKLYRYYLVKESLIKKHARSNTPYFDTLYDILEALNRTMKKLSPSVSDTNNKGFMDYMAYDISKRHNLESTNLQVNASDKTTILLNHTDYLINTGPIKQGINDMASYASSFSVRDNWWRYGAYHREQTNPRTGYLYAITQETVDLWYEMVVNLVMSALKDFDPFPTRGFPPSVQRSDWYNPNGAFKFKNDLLRDAFMRVCISYADPRRMSWVDDAWDGVPPCCNIPKLLILAQVNAQWTDFAIWNSIMNDIRQAVINTVGENGLLTEVTIDMKKYMDEVTDMHAYQENYYVFIRERIGKLFIGLPGENDCRVMDLLDQGGWVENIMQTTLNHIRDNADLSNIVLFEQTNYRMVYDFWENNLTTAAQNGSILHEELRVVQWPKVLAPGSGINIQITIPTKGVHYVDAQDVEHNMGDAPFITQWDVSITGSVRLTVNALRYSLLKGTSHIQTIYNNTVTIDLSFPVVVYSGWNLESRWLAYDIDYPMTRGYFGIPPKDDSFDPWFISKPFVELIEGMKDAADWVMDRDMRMNLLLMNYLDEGVEQEVHLSKIISDVLRTNSILLRDAANSGYLSQLDQRFNAVYSAGRVSTYNIKFYGFDATLRSGSKVLDYKSKYFTAKIDYANLKNELKYTTAEFDFNTTSEPRSGTFGKYSLTAHNTYFGKKFKTEIEVPSGKPTTAEWSRTLNGIYVPYLHQTIQLKVGAIVYGTSTMPQGVENAFSSNTQYLMPNMEDLCVFLKYALGDVYSKCVNELASKQGFGIFFEYTLGGKTYRQEYVIADFPGAGWTKDYIKTYLVSMINHIRQVVYNLGNTEIPTALYSSYPTNVGNAMKVINHWKNHDYLGDARTEATLNAHASLLGKVGAGIDTGIVRIEFEVIGTDNWIVAGKTTS